MFDWFTSDEHYGHTNIIRHCNRPWATVEKMDDALVELHNAVVQPGDTVLHLGDFAFRCDKHYARRRLERLNGRHYLILGNHDRTPGDMLDLGFCGVFTQLIWTQDGYDLLAVHNPVHACTEDVEFVLHGHSHGNRAPSHQFIDTGVDNQQYLPRTLGELIGGNLKRMVQAAEAAGADISAI